MNVGDTEKLARRFISLPQDKRQLFLDGLKKEGLDFTVFPIIANAEADDRYALSYAQQRMWFLWQLDPQSAAYNLPSAVRLNGYLDFSALKKSFDHLINRHETLRTIFCLGEGDQPIQCVEVEQSLSIVQEDLSVLPEGEREQRAKDEAIKESLKPFDLTQRPLLRVKLLKLSDEQHVLLLTLHHIIADGWSINVMIEEFIQCYDAYSCGDKPELECLPIQYCDYALWQRRWLEAGELERQLDYWMDKLGNDHPVLELPTDHARPLTPSYAGACYEFSIDEQLVQCLRELAKNNDVTLFMLLLAAFNILLYRYTGQSDLRIGVPVANRNRTETEGLIGCFINTQVLRTELDGDISVRELISSVRDTTLAAQDHQDLPFEKLVDAMKLERSLSHNPLFQVMYNHQANVADIKTIRTQSGLRLQQLEWNSQVTQFDLQLDTWESSGGLQAVFTYAADLFEAATIERLADHWQNLLWAIVEDGDQRVESLMMLKEEEIDQLLYGWNQLDIPSGSVPASDMLVPQRITAQTNLRPNEVALIFEGEQLTYAELEQQVDGLAWRLQTLGAKPGVLVGIATERNMDMVIGLLAILKVGAAYVPLDSQYPRDRLAYMIEDSGLRCLVTHSSLLGELSISEGVKILLLDETAGSSAELNKIFTSVPVHPENLAYVIYTSGSTGKPKGVAISHRALRDQVHVAIDYFELTAKDRVLLFSSLSFDGFIEQLLPALCVGADVVVRGNEIWDSETFYQEVKRTGLTIADLSAGYWHMLVQDLARRAKREQPDYGRLRQISVSGEAMPTQGIEAWQQAGMQDIRLLNIYGPTEATVTASRLDCKDYVSGDKALPASMPIGRGLAGRAMYILDGNLQPVPVGVVGQLYIGGSLLAEGYHARPGLTSGCFVVDPFAKAAGARMYATGDLAYYRENGTIEYAGRSDFQVKIRGFRIELGEIKAQLLRLVGIRDAVVVAQEINGSQYLVAYLVPQDFVLLDIEEREAGVSQDAQIDFRTEVKNQLAAVLPEYMVPTYIALLEDMPLTPNGKIDRKALPQVNASALQREYEAPTTKLEQQLAEIWQELLELEQVGLNDNFFELGGHSLLLTQVASRIRQQLAIELPLRTLFEAGDLRNFAKCVMQAELADTDQVQPIMRVSRDQRLPLSYAQQRQWVLWQLEPQSAAYHMTAALRLTGALDIEALQQSFDWLFDRHEVLRTHFVEEDGQLHQVIEAYTPFHLLAEPLFAESDASQDEAVKAELNVLGQRPFDLSRGPLLRVKLICLSEQEHVLVLVNHHIVSDDWSMQLMVGELVEAYQAFSHGQAPDTPALPIQYADFAVWQRERLEGDEGGHQLLTYWKNQLGEEHPVLALPTDHPRPLHPSYVGAALNIEIESSLRAGLQQLAGREGVTMHMLLLASFQVLLHRYCGQDEIRVGVPIANRNRLETEHLMGFFVNTQVLRADFMADLSFGELLQQIKQTTVDAQTHQDLPFEQLVEELQPERSLSHSPLFQVMFNYLSKNKTKPGSGLEVLDELVIEHLDWDIHTAQFDLSLDVNESEEALLATFNYATDLFEGPTIARMAAHWKKLLQSIVEGSDQRVQSLAILSEQEKHGLIKTLNPIPYAVPAKQLIQQQFESQVSAQPDQIALVLDGQQLTYDELNSKVNRLAHKLIELGVAPDVLVGIAVERSIEMIVGVLSILKSGGAYVPLDPAYPQDRLVYMAENSGLTLLLTQRAVDESLPLSSNIRRIYLEDSCEGFSESNPAVRRHAKNLTYMVFTSGTTGLPKGVGIDQGSLSRHIEVYSERLGLNAEDNVLQFSSLNFDTFGEQVFPTLYSGGTIVLRGEELWDNDTFYQNLHRYGISVANLTPSMWYQLITDFSSKGLKDFGRWRRMIVGGEAMPLDALKTWQQLGLDKQAELWNFYGPTEATAASTSFCCNHLFDGDAGLPSSVPIGEVLTERTVYVVDSDLNLVLPGVTGELVVGGELLARGYHKKPGLTAGSFVANPFGEEGGRLYRTGDLACYRIDGTIEYMGRNDHQVKIRGFRIELGEVEVQLRVQQQVQDAVVVAREINGSQQLIGYLMPSNKVLIDADTEQQQEYLQAVKGSLQTVLPSHMVPAHWVLIDGVPLTPNGKIDHKALPKVDSRALQKTYEAPVTDIEKRMAAIWQEVLGVERVGLNDNFFELGGDSIVSIQLVSRARQQGISVTPKNIFQYQSLGALAQVVGQVENTVVAEQGLVTGAMSLLPFQQMFFSEQIDECHHWNQSVLLRPYRPLDADLLERSLAHLLEHHDALRLQFNEQSDGGWSGSFGLVDDTPLWQREVVDESALTAVANQAQRSLDLVVGPLLRVVLFDLPDGEQRLLVVIHHLVVDGVSWRILLEDLQTVYCQLSTGATVSLPAKTSALKAWSEQFQRYTQSASLKEALHYWQSELNGINSDIPRDNPEGEQQNRYVKSVSARLDQKLTHQLLNDAPSAYRTQTNELLLTALARVICRWTQAPSALITLEGHGREDLFESIDLTRTVGCFTSMFPVNLTPSESFSISIKAIKEQLRDAHEKGIDYGILCYLSDTATQEQMQSLPQARITFNCLNQRDNSVDKAQDDLFSPAKEDCGANQSDSAPLSNWLEIDGQIDGGELVLHWSFSGEVYDTKTIRALVDDYARELENITKHCIAEENEGLTPSDFPLAELTQPLLDKLPVAIADVADIYPLTPMQEGMLLHTLMAPDSGIYFMQGCIFINNEINEDHFEQAWREVVEKHEALRSSFWWDNGGKILQIVNKCIHRLVIFKDFREMSLEEQQKRIQDLLLEERKTGFALGSEPPFRLTLIRLQDEKYFCVMSFHHILMDAWCESLIVVDYFNHYNHLTSGEPIPSSVVTPFRDYVAWLQQRAPEESLEFWRRELSDFEQRTSLPFDRLKLSEENSYAVGEEPKIPLEDSARQRMQALASQYHFTANTFVQAAWALVLYRYSGQREVLYGVTVSGRPIDQPQMQDTIGLFISTIPLKVTLPEPEKHCLVRDWLKQLFDYNVLLREHEHEPLVNIQKCTQFDNGTALFDSLFVYENAPVLDEAVSESENAGVDFISSRTHTNYPITVVVYPDEIMSFGISYDSNYFDASTIDQLLADLKYFVLALIDYFDSDFLSLPLLGDDEVKSLQQHKQTQRDYPLDKGYAYLFEQNVEMHPEKTVASCAGEEWSYRELNTNANRLAHTLIAEGVQPDTCVVLLAERDLHLLGMINGVFKAGAGYLALDPSNPQNRLASIIVSSGAKVLVCDQRTAEVAAAVIDALLKREAPVQPILVLWEDVQQRQVLTHNPNIPVDGQHLAYAIFTSGSTGIPKGVLVEQAGMLNNQLSKVPYLALTDRDVIAQTASQGFDISVWQFLTAGLCGAKVEIVPNDITQNPIALSKYVREKGVTVLEIVPTLILAILMSDTEGFPVLRHLLSTGEAMPIDMARRWLERYPEVSLINAYGPAECSDDVALHRIQIEDTESASLAVGDATDNNSLLVLNDDFSLMPLRATGELYVAGVGVGRGYLSDPARTAVTFLPNPFANKPGERIYRSGDLVRRRMPDGVIEYIGRNDQQVKIRGFRIELGEIESQLQKHNAVQEAAVLAQPVIGSQQLVAYIVAEDKALVNASDDRMRDFRTQIQSYLKTVLPDYMVPAQIFLLENMPLSSNGKLDRKALPKVDVDSFRKEFHAPTTEQEKQLAEIWQEVLGVERVGLNDNFFELGGHSLLATQVTARVREMLQSNTSITLLFTTNTLQEYAEYISHSISTNLEEDLSEMHGLLAELQEEA